VPGDFRAVGRNGCFDARPKPALHFKAIAPASDNFLRATSWRTARHRVSLARAASPLAVAEHAMALILALSRRFRRLATIGKARLARHDRRSVAARLRARPRRCLSSPRRDRRASRRLGRPSICAWLACSADPCPRHGNADAVPDAARSIGASDADFVVLTCPRGPRRTEKLSTPKRSLSMKPSLQLSRQYVGARRGRVVDERALSMRSASAPISPSAGLAVTGEDPLPPISTAGWGREQCWSRRTPPSKPGMI